MLKSHRFIKGFFCFCIVFFLFAFIHVLSAQSSCPLTIGTPYRAPLVSTVYVITDTCQKRPIFNPDVYFSHFDSWSRVVFVESYQLDAVPDHPLRFLPWGPRRTFQNGSLVKITSDPKVYLLEDGKAYPIASETAFLSLGYAFSQIEDVTEDVLASYAKQSTSINGISDLPASFVFKYANDPAVYVLRNVNGELEKLHVTSMTQLRNIAREDRLAVLPSNWTFADFGSTGGNESQDQSQTNDTNSDTNQDNSQNQQDQDDTSDNTDSQDDTSAADTTNPTVSFTSPASNATISGTVTVQASASDDVGLTSVRFSIGSTTIITDTSSPYTASLNTTSYTNGSYTLTALATDTSGNTASVTRTVTIGNTVEEADTTNPTVSFTSPASNATISGTVTVQASASDDVGLTSVRFSIGGTTITTDTSSPYTASLNTTSYANGSYTLTALATDTSGNTASVTRTVTIGNTVEETSGTVYYVSDCQAGADANCVAGDDGNAGTDPNAPWQTYAQAVSVFASLQAGDQVLFARGGSFAASSERWVNLNCRANNRCVIGDYTPSWASGDEGRPILTNLAGTIFRFENGGNSEHDEGYIVRNLELRGGGSGNGIFIYNDADDILMDNLVIDGFTLGVYSGGSNTPDPGSNGRNDGITLRNSRIINNSGQGWLGKGADILIENNEFHNNGYAKAIFNHNIYMASSENAIIRNNDLYQSAIVNGECQGVSLVGHGTMTGLVIENNTIREDVGAAAPGCWGIAIDTGYAAAEGFQGAIIRGNKVINAGNVAIGVASCPDCIIENNVIVQEQSFGTIGIAVPDRVRGSDDEPDNNVTVRNNSLYMSPIGSTGIRVGSEGTSHVITNNAIYYSGTGSFSCLDLNLPSGSYEAVNNNFCYHPNAPSALWEGNTGSLDAWRAATGFDTNSMIADPMYVSPGASSYNLDLSGGSPAINAGAASYSSAQDINGVSRGASPDIGAYEY